MAQILSGIELAKFRDEGYLVRRIMSADEVAEYVGLIDTALALRDTKTRMINLQFLQPGREVRAIQPIICQAAIRATVAALLGGGEVIVDGASLFCAEAGVDYRQGWHRDLMQIPDEEIDSSWFSPAHLHNYVQVNLALTADACLWIVPGSQSRLFSAEERAIFAGSQKMAPVDAAELSAGRQIVLQPGEAAFYNNHAVHRGYGGVLTHRRITIHLGFHSTAHAPTPHFAVLDRHEYTPDYLATLSPDVRSALQNHLDERARYPQMDVYHEYHQEFIRKEFALK